MAKKNLGGCSGSVSGHDVGGTTDGTCTWCGVQIDPRPRRPRVTGQTEMGQEYRRHYDPDYGTGRDDT